MTLFKGAGVALITPFNEDETVNYDMLGILIDRQIEGHTDAIIVCGTTGENATMSEEEIRMHCASLSEGDEPMDPTVVNYISDLMISRKKSLGTKGLSARELEIISLSKDGLSDKQIADKLCLSPRTVSNHKYRIYGKLEVSGNSEMLAKAEELGL